MENKNFLYNPNPLKVLSYISRNQNADSLYGTGISKELSINQGGTSIIMKRFEEMGLVFGRLLGKTIVYSVNKEHPLLLQFRVFENILELNSLIMKIKPFSRKVILFGSCATGEDSSSSDIDLFILSDEEDAVRKIISEYSIEREINPEIISPLEIDDFEQKNKTFYEEIMKGIVLWDKAYEQD